MTAFIEWILSQNPLMIGVAVYLIMEIRSLKASLNNHIPTQINNLESNMQLQINELKKDIERVEKQGHLERKRIEDQGYQERQKIDAKLDRLIEHLIDKKEVL